MNISNTSLQTLRTALSQAADHVPHESDFEVLTDLHLHINADNGQFDICDDDDILLSTAIIDEWTDLDSSDMQSVVHTLTTLLHRMADDGEFAETHIARPYTFVLEDESHEVIDDLYTVDDDDTIYIPGTLLQGMEQELDDFLQHLMDD